MARLIDADALLKDGILASHGLNEDGILYIPLRDVTKSIKNAPTVDAVSRGVHDQVRWERDVAIEQLESYGVSLGEKADVVKVVRCKNCRHRTEEGMCYMISGCPDLVGVGDDFFCAYGKRKDNDC